MATKIIKAGNQIIITTGSSAPKLVSVTSASNNLSLNCETSAPSSSQSNNCDLFSDVLTSSSDNNSNHNFDSQYSTFIDSGTSFLSPIECSNSYYTSYQNNQGYMQQTNLLTPAESAHQAKLTTFTLRSPSNIRNISEDLQQQQSIHYMQQETLLEGENAQFEFESHVAHTAQASPVTTPWLVDNFEPAEGCSLRRSTLYNYYLHHCTEQRLEPVNQASFGKLIRSVFLGLKTRRLGTRGNSKYHYYGIRVKVTSSLNHLNEEDLLAIKNHPLSLSPTNSPQQANNSNFASPGYMAKSFQLNKIESSPNKRVKLITNTNYDTEQAEYKPIINENMPGFLLNNGNKTVLTVSKTYKQNINELNGPSKSTIFSSSENQLTYVKTILNSKNEAENEMNNLMQTNARPQPPLLNQINMENIQLPNHCNLDDVKKFQDLYKDHCEKVFDLVMELKLTDIENMLHIFWRTPYMNQNYYENELSTVKFMNLCRLEPIIQFVKEADYQFYEFFIEILIPDPLGNIRLDLAPAVRQLGKNLDTWSRMALVNIPEQMKHSKTLTVQAFSMTLKRYTTLNHLVVTVRNTLENESVLRVMSSSLSKIDLNHIKEQAIWIIECDKEIIDKLEKEFKESLTDTYSTTEKWLKWLDSTLSCYLHPYEGTENYAKMAKSFLIKWSFFSTSIIRDLTLRSADSFGSFHMLRLLLDEYLYYIIEHKIAKAYNLKHLEAINCKDLIINSSN